MTGYGERDTMPERKYYGQQPVVYREQAKEWYRKNRQRILDLQKERRKSPEWQAAHKKAFKKHKLLKKYLVDKLKDWPCMDCGGSFPPCCMDFDHVRGKKLFEVSSIVVGKWDKILKEIAKCDLVCANCHRLRHKKRDS